ncbi:MAG TPA: type II transport protein [Planctomycetes bacterium]|nr:type II transport protein [Planctomycetota bacterium]
MHHNTEVKPVRVMGIKSLCVMRETEIRNQKSEVRSQKSEIRNQKSEVRNQRSEGLFSVFCFLSSVTRRSEKTRRFLTGPATSSGFTAVEILIVVVIIAIAAMMAIPMMTSAASFQIRSAANMIAADLEYAKSMAISRSQSFSVVFDETTDSYRIEDQDGTIIAHPVKKGFDYVVDFPGNSRLNKVDIFSVGFEPGSSDTITFDYMGSPYSGSGTSNPLNSGVITLQAAGTSTTINIEPVTGFIFSED